MTEYTREAQTIAHPSSFVASLSPHTQESTLHGDVVHAERSALLRFLKRVVDISCAFIGLAFLLPVFIVIALFIKLESPGPLFFRQKRLGRGGRLFDMLKLRSMYVDADEMLVKILDDNADLRQEYGRFHKLKDDPRVTAIGRITRKYSIDELPQLWNVLVGDMSLVGPRPYLPGELYKMQGNGARHILSIRPGLTGLWQTGGRNHLSFTRRLELDVDYVERWSPWLDMKLVLRTIPVILKGEGAS